MSENPTRRVRPGDRWSQEALDEDEYWLCECGVARKTADKMLRHLDDTGHIAERLDSTEGVVTGFLVGDLEYDKYTHQIPRTAQIKRDGLHNDPLFELTQSNE